VLRIVNSIRTVIPVKELSFAPDFHTTSWSISSAWIHSLSSLVKPGRVLPSSSSIARQPEPPCYSRAKRGKRNEVEIAAGKCPQDSPKGTLSAVKPVWPVVLGGAGSIPAPTRFAACYFYVRKAYTTPILLSCVRSKYSLPVPSPLTTVVILSE